MKQVSACVDAPGDELFFPYFFYFERKKILLVLKAEDETAGIVMYAMTMMKSTTVF